MEKKSKKGILGKILKIIGISIISLILIVVVGIYVVWHHEIGTMLSIKEIAPRNEEHQDGATYIIEYKGGYWFDQYLEQGGCATDSQLVDFVIDHITHGLIQLSITPGKTGCSAFTATLDDGDRIMGRNYDMKETGTAIVHTKPGNGRHESYSTIDFRFISVGVEGANSLYRKLLCLAAPYVPMDGMNDAGVAVGIFMSNQGTEGKATDQNTDKPDLTSSAMVRLILDYADDVEEAIELVKAYDLHDSAGYSYHYMVSDAKGNSAVLEWINPRYEDDNNVGERQLVVTYCDEKGYQAVTNYIIAEGYYDTCGDDVELGGLDRYQAVMEKLDATEGHLTDEEEAMDVLNMVSRRDWTAKPGLTIHSVVYNLTDKSILWVGNEHYGEESYTFRFTIK